MSEGEDTMEREMKLKKDRLDQAKWYESLNLYAEALRIYRTLGSEQDVKRLEERMREEYSKNAKRLEMDGRYQDAANLYFLIDDNAGVKRMKGLKPDLVIIYDKEEGGLAKLASTLRKDEGQLISEDYFSKPNISPEERIRPQKEEKVEAPEERPAPGGKGVPVKMPLKKRAIRFCPYCGESVLTKKEPKFCPYCGEDLD